MKNKVRGRRSQTGMTQAELATALGVSRQTVISIENGRYLPSLSLAFRIARLFELPLEQLFEPTEEDGRSQSDPLSSSTQSRTRRSSSSLYPPRAFDRRADISRAPRRGA